MVPRTATTTSTTTIRTTIRGITPSANDTEKIDSYNDDKDDAGYNDDKDEFFTTLVGSTPGPVTDAGTVATVTAAGIAIRQVNYYYYYWYYYYWYYYYYESHSNSNPINLGRTKKGQYGKISSTSVGTA
jgi:hypothetical protein